MKGIHMKRGYFLMAMAACCLFVLTACATVHETAMPPVAEESQWLTSFDAALAEAQQSGKPIMATFTASHTDPWGAPWCYKLNLEVFEQPEFKVWAEENVVPVLLLYPFTDNEPQDEATKKSNAELAEKYDVAEYPTIIFMTPDGTPLGLVGYVRGGALPWIEEAQKILDANK